MKPWQDLKLVAELARLLRGFRGLNFSPLIGWILHRSNFPPLEI
jgi:hypothetical protein